jgi:hypothetical protein
MVELTSIAQLAQGMERTNDDNWRGDDWGAVVAPARQWRRSQVRTLSPWGHGALINWPAPNCGQ